MKADGRRKETIYAIGCLLVSILMIGSVCSLQFDVITMGHFFWQMIWAIICGMFCAYGIYLEETRAARRRR